MSRMQLNKTSLNKQTKDLKTYNQFLPSLDLKRRKLTAERAKEERQQLKLETKIKQYKSQIAKNIPMMANEDIVLEGLIKVSNVKIDDENIVGVHVPALSSVEFEVEPYSLFNTPHWVDKYIEDMKALLELEIKKQISTHRVELLEISVQIVTQRVNLFEKVLIPKSKDNIRKIQIFLSDAECAGVVRSKMAKQKRAAA